MSTPAPLRRTLLVALAAAVPACSGSPSSPVAPGDSGSGAGTWVAGRVVDQFTGAGIAGAEVALGATTVVTDATGAFEAKVASPTVTVSGASIHARTLPFPSDGRIEVLPAGFDLDAFSDVARERDGRTVRWTRAPRIYLDARAHGTEIAGPRLAAWVDEVAAWAPVMIADWTGGALGVAAVTVGTSPPPTSEAGWIVIRFDEDPSVYPSASAAGVARTRWSAAREILSVDIALRFAGLDGGPQAPLSRQVVVAHELGHALGLGHMDGGGSSMMTPVIRSVALTRFDQEAGAVLYRRAPGNTHVDRDPLGTASSLAPAAQAVDSWACAAVPGL